MCRSALAGKCKGMTAMFKPRNLSSNMNEYLVENYGYKECGDADFKTAEANKLHEFSEYLSLYEKALTIALLNAPSIIV